jgi:hypothetical protein
MRVAPGITNSLPRGRPPSPAASADLANEATDGAVSRFQSTGLNEVRLAY